MLQTLVAVFAVGTMAGVVESDKAQAGTLVICTARGLVQVTVDADGNVVEPPVGGSERMGVQDCGLCVMHGAAAAPDSPLSLAVVRLVSTAKLPVAAQDLPNTSKYRHGLHARAPPFQAL